MPEARLEDNGSGLAPAGDGWFVVNVGDAQWLTSEGGEKQPSGSECSFESGKAEFTQLGVRLHVLPPGESNGLYHREDKQEDFLVLAGECLLLIEGEERRLHAWDFAHCPPGTEHVFVGAGGGPCVILMVGARAEDWNVLYPVSELAARYGACADEETSDRAGRTSRGSSRRAGGARPTGTAFPGRSYASASLQPSRMTTASVLKPREGEARLRERSRMSESAGQPA